MSEAGHHEVTQLLRAWSNGDEKALEALLPLVYQELHNRARHFMARERSARTLQATALIGEVYLRLVSFKEMNWNDRAHFFAVCARMMRRILTDAARGRHYLKRGGKTHPMSLDEALVISGKPRTDFVALDDALNSLAAVDPRKSQVVELRFFGGLSVEETAQVLKISPETVMRDWKLAKVWLLRELSEEQRGEA
jgi:RNA polymerase sigma-70 factor (ECF subfamily)